MASSRKGLEVLIITENIITHSFGSSCKLVIQPLTFPHDSSLLADILAVPIELGIFPMADVIIAFFPYDSAIAMRSVFEPLPLKHYLRRFIYESVEANRLAIISDLPFKSVAFFSLTIMADSEIKI